MTRAVGGGTGTAPLQRAALKQFVLVRFFHEIALKGGNRGFFTRHMLENLEEALKGTGVGRVMRRSMGALLPLQSEVQWQLLQERLGGLIGVERFARARQVEPSLEALKKALAQLLEGHTAHSFRITARRSDKGFPLSSPQINEELGAFVQGLTGLSVDLEHPDLNLQVHIDPREALVALEEFPGLSGMPVGVSGPVAALLSGGIDSPVAAFQMMQRGCHVLFIHFHSFPLVEGTSREKAQDLVTLLTRYQFRSRLLLVPFSQAQQRIIVSVPPAYRVVLYRRFMFRIAEALALRHGARALVTGESLGQVSSQTLDNLATIDAAAEQLITLRPLISMHKESIVTQARQLGTYPISIIPDQDCCSLFVPKHPVTRSRRDEVDHLESSLSVKEIVQEAVEATEERLFHWP